MPASTPTYKLPYPVSSDPLNQGAVAIANLANRLELILANAGIPAPASSTEPAAELDADPAGDATA